MPYFGAKRPCLELLCNRKPRDIGGHRSVSSTSLRVKQVRAAPYRSDSVGSLEEPSQDRSMDRMYSRGATLRVRLNNVLKAAGLSYPRSAAVSVTDAPAVSFGSAARMHACCRHATKLSPVSRRNNRVNVRRVRCSESAQSSIFAFAFGDAENLRQRRARALSVGNVRDRGSSRSRPIS